METKICKTCKCEKPISEFTKHSSSRDGFYRHCKTCKRSYDNSHYGTKRSKLLRASQHARRSDRRTFILEYLKTHPCVDCGNSDIRVLEFDHIRSNKFMGISYMVGANYSMARIKDEIEKCEVVCANCHRIRTYTRSESYRTPTAFV